MEKYGVYFTATEFCFWSPIISKSTTNHWEFFLMISYNFSKWHWIFHPDDKLVHKVTWLFFGEFNFTIIKYFSFPTTKNDNPTTGFHHEIRLILFYDSIDSVYFFICMYWNDIVHYYAVWIVLFEEEEKEWILNYYVRCQIPMIVNRIWDFDFFYSSIFVTMISGEFINDSELTLEIKQQQCCRE